MFLKNYNALMSIVLSLILGFGIISTNIIISSGSGIYQFIAVRFILSSIICYIYLRKSLTFKKSDLILGIKSGILIFLFFSFQTMGIKYTSVTNVALITSFNCIFTQLLFRAFKNEKFGLNRIVATLLLMLIIMLANEFKITNFNSGDLAVLISAFCLSLNIFCVSIGKTCESDLNSITHVSIIVCGVLALFIASAGEPTIGNSISLKILINYLYMIILGTSFFYIM